MCVIVDFGAPGACEPQTEAGRGFVDRVERRATCVGADPSVIDHDHLARYTLGNRDLEIEVLDLFAGEAPRTLARLRAAAEALDQRAWHLASHTLKGSARAVGAWKVAHAAEQAERQSLDDAGAVLARVAGLDAAVADVIGYLAALRVPAGA